MVRMGRVYRVFIVFATVVGIFVSFSSSQALDCYEKWYLTREDFISPCPYCDYDSFNKNSTDTCPGKHPRQYGVILCSSHRRKYDKEADFYKRGYSDYNCLAYALGKNGVQSWTWPKKDKNALVTISEFKAYIKKLGYKCTVYEPVATGMATGKKIFYVYAKNGYVTHFARKYTLGGTKLDGVATISKWGQAALYKATTTDPYEPDSIYGRLEMICYK